ncbi:MAG: hypothetical protein WC307_05980 [Candidatus Nanoarchaeia archaeon]|jgi:hypothetical protein
MKITLSEVIERGLHLDKYGHVTDPSGNEYREEGEACWLNDGELKLLLIDYIDYAEQYPMDHEDDNYPACFSEWFDNDYLNGGEDL